jgi:hypothetical protein
LDLALRNHAQLLDEKLRIGEAIDWIVPWHVLAEIRLLAAITAFEGLLAGHSSTNGGLVPSSCFREHIRPRLEAVLLDAEVRGAVSAALDTDIASTQVDEVLHEIVTKLGGLNQRSLSRRLAEFMRHYDVPIDDLPISIVELLRTRNRVVHGGGNVGTTYEERTTGRAAMMREVLRRTLLAMLGYSGHFYSYLGETQWLTFGAPPTRRV